MSQKSLPPKSLRTPKSNSLNCHDVKGTRLAEGQTLGSALDQLQRQVEEELRHSDRLLVAADDLIAESRGSVSRNYSRSSSKHDGSGPCSSTSYRPSTAPGSCLSFLRTSSFCNEKMEVLPQSSSPQSVITYRSRDAASKESQRRARVPSPECITLKSKAGSPSMQTSQNVVGEYNANESEALESGYYTNIGTDFSFSRNPSNLCRCFGETSNSSALNYLPSSAAGSRVMPSDVGSASGMNYHVPQEQPTVSKGKFSSKGNCKPGGRFLCPAENTSVAAACDMSKASSRVLFPFKDRLRNEPNESEREFQAQPAHWHGRGAISNSSPFASTPVKEIVVPPQSRHNHTHHNAHPASSPFGRKSQFPAYDEDMKPSKNGSDPFPNHYHHDNLSDSPYNFLERDEKTTAALGHLSQLKKTPSYFRCGLDQGIEFLNVCCPKVKDTTRAGGKVAKLPKIPCLKAEDIDNLIKCETKDVESAWYLTSREKKTYKKPCPKQQKAHLAVKSIVQTYTTQICGAQMYTPLEHPDPEDISPELAAAIMFSQEQGIDIEECPDATIAHLFPDQPKPLFSEKTYQGSVSVVDPNQKDQKEMIEKSAAVPSEGVSDSAYTRTMKDKGEDVGPQRSYNMDFAIGQSKREYVLVTQKPQRINKVQFRGGNSPSWFPGYFSAFPNEQGLKVVSSPSELFYKAWVHSNPENIPTSDVIVLE